MRVMIVLCIVMCLCIASQATKFDFEDEDVATSVQAASHANDCYDDDFVDTPSFHAKIDKAIEFHVQTYSSLANGDAKKLLQLVQDSDNAAFVQANADGIDLMAAADTLANAADDDDLLIGYPTEDELTRNNIDDDYHPFTFVDYLQSGEKLPPSLDNELGRDRVAFIMSHYDR